MTFIIDFDLYCLCCNNGSCKVSPSVEVVIDVERDKDDDAHSNRDFPHSSFEVQLFSLKY